MKLMISPLLRENFRVSLTTVKTNRLRSILTILIIAVGIMALVGILTAIDAIKASVTDTFNSMGASSMLIKSKYAASQSGTFRKRKRNTSVITYQQARDFARNYRADAVLSVYTTAKQMLTVKFGSEQSNPEITAMGIDLNYLEVNVLALAQGRNFSDYEMASSSYVAIIGRDVAALFKNVDPIGEFINVDGLRYQVIGIIASKGAEMGGGVNKQIFIPLSNARSVYGSENQNFIIKILPAVGVNVDDVYAEAEMLFRSIRRLSPADESDFDIERSDAILEKMMDTMRYVTLTAFVIGFITLLGASIGLMNIMLVSVNERTREIGTRKAMGAKSSTIRQQFLFEAMTIGQIGGLLGVVLGIIAGNITAVVMHAPFVMPWLWILVGISVCLIVSLLSGFIPAQRAARLDPIEALRYE